MRVSAKGGDVTTRLIELSGISFISSDESPKKVFPYSVVKYGMVCIKNGILYALIALVEHDFDVVAGVPVAVIIKAAGFFEDAGELHAARAHVVNVSLGVLVAVGKGTLLPGLAPKDLVIAVGVERRVNVNQVNAGAEQFGELFQIVAAIDDAGVQKGGGFLQTATIALTPALLPSDGRGGLVFWQGRLRP